MDKQLLQLGREINSAYKAAPTTDEILLDGRTVPSSECEFHHIPANDQPGVLSCINGGNDTILDTPFCVATLNKLFCSAFRGRERLRVHEVEPLKFLSLMRYTAKGPKFDFFPYADNQKLLPGDDMLANAARELTDQDGKHLLHSLPTVLGEWLMAREAALLLQGGSVIMDGSLSVWGETRRALAGNVMGVAGRNNVVVCGLSKTTDLQLAGGRPLLDYINDKYGGGANSPWYVDIGQPPEDPKPGDYHTMVVKLHMRSAWLYRLDMDAVMYQRMGRDGAEAILGSLVANSSDATMPGYPYALLRADRYAKIHRDESSAFAIHLQCMLDAGPRRAAMHNAQHDYRNRVTGG